MVVVLVKNQGSKQATCTNCASVLSYMPSERKKHTHRDYTGDVDTYYTINCPACGEKTIVR